MAEETRSARLLAHPFWRFAAVGAAGFFVDIAALRLGLLAGLGLYFGRVFSYLCAATFTWWFNRRHTFAMRASPSLREWAKFLLANSTGGLINYAVYSALVTFIAFVATYPEIAVAAGSVAGLAVNYLASARFVFRERDDGDSASR